MRVFVAGASGAIGTRLVPQLVDRGHEVIGTSSVAREGRTVTGARRRAGRARSARRRGRAPGRARSRAGRDRPSGDRPGGRTLRAQLRPHLRADEPAADRGHRRAARRRARGAGRPVRRPELRQLPHAREGGLVKTEDDPLDPAPPAKMRESQAAMRHLDEVVTDAGGIALRYGVFYGAANDGLVEPVRKRQFPIVGDGGGVILVHPPRRRRRGDRARARTRRAGIFNIVDDEPAPVREWLPVLAEALGAKPPRHFPRWLARLVAGEVAVVMGTEYAAAPRTPRPSASSAGSRATPAGERASWRPTRRPPSAEPRREPDPAARAA